MGFDTENKFLLQPITFSVRTFVLADLFAGKMHAVLCRQWKSRVKGRDWAAPVWFVAHHPQLHLAHLEQRVIQSRHLKEGEHLSKEEFLLRISNEIDNLDVNQIKKEVEPFVKNPEVLEVWSKEFFQDVAKIIGVRLKSVIANIFLVSEPCRKTEISRKKCKMRPKRKTAAGYRDY